MTESTSTTYSNRQTESGIRFLGFALPLTAVIITCHVNYCSTSMLTIEHPLILVFGSIFTIVPFRSENFLILQKVIIFYLFAVLVNQTTDSYFTLSSLSIDASVSYSAVTLFLCTTGYLLDKLYPVGSKSINRQNNILRAWSIAFIVIILHMAFLALLLHKFYGYGYGHNLYTIGNLVLYLLLFIVLWERLGSIRFRMCTGMTLMVFYLIPIFANK